MKTIAIAVLLCLAAVAGHQGYIYTQFDNCLQEIEKSFYAKEYAAALATIDRLRQNRWYKPILNYQWLDIWEVDKNIDYQKGRIEVELGNLKEAYAAFDKCAVAKDAWLASHCLYQQGNVVLYQGNSIAEKKWQAALEKYGGGQDFDAQVNLELLKSQKKKAQSAADTAMQTHRRSKDRHFYLRKPTQKDGPIKP